MTSRRRPLCYDCIHFHRDSPPTCGAYALGIPGEIFFEGYDHRQPAPGDGGVQFSPANPAPADTAQRHTPGGHDHDQSKHAGGNKPDERSTTLDSVVIRWVSDSSEAYSIRRQQIEGNPDRETQALLDAVAASDEAPEIYRGVLPLPGEPESFDYPDGAEFPLALSSFSSSLGVAYEFSGPAGYIFAVKGAEAYRVPEDQTDEAEFITTGLFRVVERSHRHDENPGESFWDVDLDPAMLESEQRTKLPVIVLERVGDYP